MSTRSFTIKELADQAGVSTSAIRSWERRFAIFSPSRTVGGHRLYSVDDLKLFLFVKHLQSQKKELKDISHLGRLTLIEQARAFYTANEGKAANNQPSNVTHIVDAAINLNLSKLAQLVDHLKVIAVSPIDFSETILCVIGKLRQNIPAVSLVSLAFFAERAESHLAAALLTKRTRAPAATALCARMTATHSINLLRTAHYLRSWGYQPIVLQSELHMQSLLEVVRQGNISLLCISMEGIGEYNPKVLQFLAEELSQHTLVCIIANRDSKLSVDLFEQPEFRSIYLIKSMLEFEILAEMKLKDARQPTQMLESFRSTWHQS